MGRLLKSKIDQIVSLRKQGYCQKEIAEKLDVHIKTVRKYDPTSGSDTSKPVHVEKSVEAIREVLLAVLDLLDVMVPLLLDKDNHPCPKCYAESLGFDVRQVAFICRNCGYTLILPSDICYHCLSQGKMDYNKESRKWFCQQCGASK